MQEMHQNNVSLRCPTCSSGQDISYNFAYLTEDQRVNAILDHIHENTLTLYHNGDIIRTFFSCIMESPLENLQLWVQHFGVPKNPTPVSDGILPKENFIYLLDCGADPNNFAPWYVVEGTVHGMNTAEKIKILISYGYKITSYQNDKEHILKYIDDITIFLEVLELFTFTTEDAKHYIQKYLRKAIEYSDTYLPIILHLAKLFNLQEFVRSQSIIQRALEFNQMLD